MLKVEDFTDDGLNDGIGNLTSSRTRGFPTASSQTIGICRDWGIYLLADGVLTDDDGVRIRKY